MLAHARPPGEATNFGGSKNVGGWKLECYDEHPDG
jgi:hypothetical protein